MKDCKHPQNKTYRDIMDKNFLKCGVCHETLTRKIGDTTDKKPTKEIFISFEGVNFWGNPIFKDINTTIRYGSTSRLLPSKNVAPNGTVEEINKYFKENIGELEYFGASFDCEPNGGMPPHYKLIIQEK